MASIKALSFGEVLWDVYPDRICIGGAPLNFAAHLARHGNQVFFVSSVGEDELGRKALEQIEKWNVSTEYVSISKSLPTGQCIVSLDGNGTPTYNILPDTACDSISSDGITQDFDLLYFGTFALRSKYNFNSLRSLIESHSFKEIFVDLNIRPPFSSDDAVIFALNNATIIKISLEELPFVARALNMNSSIAYRDFAKKLSSEFKAIKCIIVTLGEDGAYAFEPQSGKESNCQAKKVSVLSTVGAGDSFSAAFLHQYFNNTLDHSLIYATNLAGYVVSKYEAVPDYNVEDLI